MREDRVGVLGKLHFVVEHLTAGLAQDGDKGVVFRLRSFELRLRDVVPVLRVGTSEGLVGSADEDLFQGLDHALGTE